MPHHYEEHETQKVADDILASSNRTVILEVESSYTVAVDPNSPLGSNFGCSGPVDPGNMTGAIAAAAGTLDFIVAFVFCSGEARNCQKPGHGFQVDIVVPFAISIVHPAH